MGKPIQLPINTEETHSVSFPSLENISKSVSVVGGKYISIHKFFIPLLLCYFQGQSFKKSFYSTVSHTLARKKCTNKILGNSQILAKPKTGFSSRDHSQNN